MDIALYISELLKDCKEIGLPGIGTFSRRRTPSRYDREAGVIHPPTEEIVFSQGNGNDTELVNYLSAIKKISEASARYFINKYADSIRQQLELDGMAELSGLGKLEVQNGVYSMAPLQLTAMAFGQDILKDPAFVIPQERSPAPTPPPVASVSRLTGNDYAEEPVYAEAEETKSGNTVSLILSLLFLVLIAAGLVYIFNPEFFNLDTDKPIHARTVTPQKKTTSAPAQPAVAADSSSLGKNKVEVRDSAVTPAVKKEAVPVPAAKPAEVLPRYEVIGASFALKSEADEYVRRLSKKSIKASVVEDARKPKFKVSLGSFNNYDEATIQKRKIQASFNKEAWILTINDKEKQ